MAKILILRLSSIGDVTMTIPVVYSVAQAYPEDTFTVLTQPFLTPIFINRPPNIELSEVNIKGTEKKLSGLLRFCFNFAKYDYDIIIDLHDVIRTKIIRSFFRFKGIPVHVIRRNSAEKKMLTAKNNKELKQLITRIELYSETLNKAGFNFGERFTTLFGEEPAVTETILPFSGKKEGKWIGIAPFATHQSKIYPLGHMEKVIETISQWENTSIFLFGGGAYEKNILEQWESRYPHVRNVAGKFSLDKELAFISLMDVLISMDSANMHFASLVSTKVISIWGATHPYAGFYGYKQNPENAIQLDMPCRPCSIYGNKKCHRGDWACMDQLEPEIIVKKIKETLESNEL